VKKEVRKDSKRNMRVDDILGAQTRINDSIPRNKLPSLHPVYMNKEE